jgi:hypothetical protein
MRAESEIWKDIKGYEGVYQVSNLGRVKNKQQLILSQSIDTNGYYKINLNKGGIRKTWGVHRLVAKAFIPNPENKYSVDHIDRDKLNNNLSNLRWATRQENTWNGGAYKTYRGQARRNKHKGVYYSPTYKAAPKLNLPSGRKIAEDLKKGIDNRYTITRKKPWCVQIMVNGKRKGFGWYCTEKEAVEVYDKKIKELRGDFATLNYEN